MTKRGRTPDLSSATSPLSAIRSLLRLRFAECLEQQNVLTGEDDDAIHAFRLACKRLRYAIERWPDDVPHLQVAAALLSDISDELGSAHDCVIIARRAKECNALTVAGIALADRHRFMARAIQRWREGFGAEGAFSSLAAFTTYHWRPNGSH